jgi:hypothetical protein
MTSNQPRHDGFLSQGGGISRTLEDVKTYSSGGRRDYVYDAVEETNLSERSMLAGEPRAMAMNLNRGEI